MFRQIKRLRFGMVRTVSHRAIPHPKARMMATGEGASLQHQIDLFTGWPNPGLLPPEGLRNAANGLLSDASIVSSILRYGEDEGYIELRREVAKWLSTFYRPKQDISYKRICITGGASQNLACILQTFTDPVYTRNVCEYFSLFYVPILQAYCCLRCGFLKMSCGLSCSMILFLLYLILLLLFLNAFARTIAECLGYASMLRPTLCQTQANRILQGWSLLRTS